MRGRLAAALVALGLGAGACGGEQPRGDPVAGERLVVEEIEPSCGRCHTLADADFAGTVGPNLDFLRPGYQRVLDAIRQGPGLMPSYRELDVRAQHDIAAYVSGAAAG